MMRRLALLLVFPLILCAAAASSSCATRGLSAKQTITIDVLQPSHDALAALQDFEVETFNAKTLPALTLEAHQKIERLLATAFRDHAKATRAVRVWRSSDPVPSSVLDLSKDVHDVLDVVKTTVPATSRVLTLAEAAVDEAARVLATLQRGGV
jgi:hypothetical protein